MNNYSPHEVAGDLEDNSSLVSGILWQGAGGWTGFDPAAPFYFDGALALIAALLMALWKPKMLIGDTIKA